MSEQTSRRPLSPHLQIYKPQLTSVMSILHRFCGAAMAAGTVAVVWGLLAAATGEDAWNSYYHFWTTMLGRLMLAGWTAAFFYHLCNGVRHLIWDTVHLLDIQNAYRAGFVVLAAAALLTAYGWSVIFM